jgi:S1-C subfamily serine protease
MKKILKIIVLSLFFCGSAYAEFIELKKCFKSAGYGFGNDEYDSIGKSWDSWLPRYIYTGDFDKCRDFDMNIVFNEKLNYSECYTKNNLNHLTSSEDVIIDGVTWTSDVNPLIDPKDWKKLNLYNDNIFSINTSNETITNLIIKNQEVINFKIKYEKFHGNRITKYYFSIKEFEKGYAKRDETIKWIGMTSEQYVSEDYTINSYAGGIVKASKPGGDRYHGIGLYKQIIEKNELFIDLNSSKIEIKKEVFNTGHKHTQSQLPKRYTVRTIYSCDKKSKDDGEKETGASSGTAFFINKKGYLLTNNHVVDGCTLSKISYKNKEYDTKLIATDKTLDLALLKAELKPKTFINFSKDEAKKLDTIYVAGYPLGKGLSNDLKINPGSVSSLKGFEDNSNEIQIDAPINPGNSGGPIINENGNLIAIAVSGMAKDQTEGINFGIKSSAAERFLKSNNINVDKSLYSRFKNKEQLRNILEEGTVYTYCN